MTEEINLLDISDELLIINKTTIERLFQEEDMNVVVLYIFYYKTAKWQKHNPIKASDEYCRKCLHWGLQKVKNIKKRLKEMELISVEKRTNKKNQIDGWYIRINYYIDNNSSGSISSGSISPLVAKPTHKILNNNNINTNNNKNTNKEIYKEICKRVITKLNELNDTKYSPTSDGNIKFIKGRLQDGYTEEDLMLVVDKMSYLWNQPSEKDMRQYLRPSTLFRPTNFENYLNMPIKEQKITSKELATKMDFTDFIKKGMRK